MGKHFTWSHTTNTHTHTDVIRHSGKVDVVVVFLYLFRADGGEDDAMVAAIFLSSVGIV